MHNFNENSNPFPLTSQQSKTLKNQNQIQEESEDEFEIHKELSNPFPLSQNQKKTIEQLEQSQIIQQQSQQQIQNNIQFQQQQQQQINQNEQNNNTKKNVQFLFLGNKAGLENIDKEKVKQTIYEASKDSEYFKKQEEKRVKYEQKVKEMKHQIKVGRQDINKINAIKSEIDRKMVEYEKQRLLNRQWVHFDIDMFYVAVEMRDNPSLKDKPCAVGGQSMISTANYIARKFGVRSAMPGFIAKKLCPDLLLLDHSPEKYREASKEFKAILAEYDPEYESMGGDEANLDITNYLREHDISGKDQIWDLCETIRKRVYDKIKLTISCGIAPNKMLAKLGSDMNKPNGQFYIPPDAEKIKDFMKSLSIRKIPGIGNVSEQILVGIGFNTCEDLLKNIIDVRIVFQDSSFDFFIRAALGIARTYHELKEAQKSISVSRTFKAISDQQLLLKKTDQLSKMLSDDLKAYQKYGKHIQMTFKTIQFNNTNKSLPLNAYTDCPQEIYKACEKLIKQNNQPVDSLRLLGIKMGDLIDKDDYEKQSIQKFFKPQQQLQQAIQQQSNANNFQNSKNNSSKFFNLKTNKNQDKQPFNSFKNQNQFNDKNRKNSHQSGQPKFSNNNSNNNLKLGENNNSNNNIENLNLQNQKKNSLNQNLSNSNSINKVSFAQQNNINNSNILPNKQNSNNILNNYQNNNRKLNLIEELNLLDDEDSDSVEFDIQKLQKGNKKNNEILSQHFDSSQSNKERESGMIHFINNQDEQFQTQIFSKIEQYEQICSENFDELIKKKEDQAMQQIEQQQVLIDKLQIDKQKQKQQNYNNNNHNGDDNSDNIIQQQQNQEQDQQQQENIQNYQQIIVQQKSINNNDQMNQQQVILQNQNNQQQQQINQQNQIQNNQDVLQQQNDLYQENQQQIIQENQQNQEQFKQQQEQFYQNQEQEIQEHKQLQNNQQLLKMDIQQNNSQQQQNINQIQNIEQQQNNNDMNQGNEQQQQQSQQEVNNAEIMMDDILPRIFTCIICNKEIDCKANIARMNNHINDCLKQQEQNEKSQGKKQPLSTTNDRNSIKRQQPVQQKNAFQKNGKNNNNKKKPVQSQNIKSFFNKK